MPEALPRFTITAGREVYVRKSSSYATHLKTLNAALKSKKRKPIQIKEAQRYIVTEDILDMVNAGVIPITVADLHIGKAWQQVMPNSSASWIFLKNMPAVMTSTTWP